MFPLSQQQRYDIGSSLRQYVNACDGEKSNVSPRWKEVRGHYNLDITTAGVAIFDDVPGERIPFYRPQCDRVQQSLSAAFYSVEPWAQLQAAPDYADEIEAQKVVNDALGEDAPRPVIPALERTMQSLVSDSNLRDQHSIAFRNMVHSNCGMLRVRVGDDGVLQADNIHPENVLFYPIKVSDYKKLLCVGHRFNMMRFECQEKIDRGEFYKDLNANEFGTAQKVVDPINTQPDQVIDHDTDLLELYEFNIRLKLGKDKTREWYIGVVDAVSGTLLRLEKSPYSRPWYFVFRTSFDEDSMIPMYSLGTTLVPIQRTVNNIWSLLVQGGFMSAFPLTVISGAEGLRDKVSKMKAGQVMFESNEVKMQQIRSDFNPTTLPMMLNMAQGLGDAVTGISRLGQSQTLPSSTTATAANGMLAAQDASRDSYVESCQTVMADMFDFILELMATHSADISKAMAGKWELLPDDNIRWRDVIVQVTGSGATSSPMLLMQKMQMLIELAKDPNSGLDSKSVIEMLIEALDLPFAIDGLKVKNEDLTGTMGGLPQVPGMGGGMPPPDEQGIPIDPQVGGLSGGGGAIIGGIV